MALNILRLPRLIAERRSTAILGMLIIGMLWANRIPALQWARSGSAAACHCDVVDVYHPAAMERMLRAEARAHQKASSCA
jgi:hypothetical protein